MDLLTLGCNYLLKQNRKGKPDEYVEIDLSKVLKSFEMNMDEFIDLCILCGCDYS